MSQQPNNSKTSLLSGLLKDQDSLVKLTTLILVIVGGGGNFLATKQTSEINHAELERAISEIHYLHTEFADAVARQKRLEDMLQKLKPPGP